MTAARDPHDSTGGPHGGEPPHGKYLAFLSLAALGVVYGDIGTSPIVELGTQVEL